MSLYMHLPFSKQMLLFCHQIAIKGSKRATCIYFFSIIFKEIIAEEFNRTCQQSQKGKGEMTIVKKKFAKI